MSIDGKDHIDCCPTLEESSRRCADLLVATARRAIFDAGRFTLALAGGSTPKRLYELLAEEPNRSAVDWSHVYVFWGDERCVPLDHPDSNYRMAAETFLSGVVIPDNQVFPMPGKMSPKEGARHYETLIRGAFQLEEGVEIPSFDLVLLGMGEDGHTASLFPGDAALLEKERMVVAVRPPAGVQPGIERLTMTLPLINKARNVCFLVSGLKKTKVAAAIIDSIPGTGRLPAALVRPQEGCRWFLSAFQRE